MAGRATPPARLPLPGTRLAYKPRQVKVPSRLSFKDIARCAFYTTVRGNDTMQNNKTLTMKWLRRFGMPAYLIRQDRIGQIHGCLAS